MFSSGPKTRETDTTNEAGGTAYAMDTKHAIAQFAVTGCFNNTYYSDGKAQLNQIKEKISELPATIETFKFIARLAIYSRHSAFMKDMPAYLVATLCNYKIQVPAADKGSTGYEYHVTSKTETKEIISKVFNKVINNGKMLRNFVQIIRSGATGRKSLGTFPKRLVKEWIQNRSGETLFRNSIGNDPSMLEIIKMVRPKHEENEVIKYLVGHNLTEDDMAKLPRNITHYEAFKQYLKLSSEQRDAYGKMELPKVDFQFLTSLKLEPEHWKSLASNATWQQTRINLNTFNRHNVFNEPDLIKEVAEKLKHPDAIKKAKAMPYQLLAASKATSSFPIPIKDALEDALYTSLQNAPTLEGETHIFVDGSGSMTSSATGGYNSTISCADVATLFAIGLLKANPGAKIYSCDRRAYPCEVYHRDSLATIHSKIMDAHGHGGTDTSECFKYLTTHKIKADNVVIISDGQSWAHYPGGLTPMQAFDKYRHIRNRKVKLLAINIQPYTSMQFDYDPSILHVGGFNDSVFLVAEKFFNSSTSNFIQAIEEVEL